MTTPQNAPVAENFPLLAPNTIVPEDQNLFNPYLNRLYEDIAYSVNTKDNIYFPMAITDTATNIINLSQFGAFIICISGQTSTLPTLTASLTKADATIAGTIAVLGSQAGSAAPWAAATLTITSTATNFQVAHSVAGQSGSFNIRIIGSQVPPFQGAP